MYSIINRKMLQRTGKKFFPVADPLLKGAVTAALAALGIFALLFEYPCPFLTLTGAPCLGCGTTHAVRELLAGNFSDVSVDLAVFLRGFQAAEKQEMQRRRLCGNCDRLSARLRASRSFLKRSGG